MPSVLARRVRAIENVTVLDGHDVVEPVADQVGRVTGARVVNRDTGEEAELVINGVPR